MKRNLLNSKKDEYSNTMSIKQKGLHGEVYKICNNHQFMVSRSC